MRQFMTAGTFGGRRPAGSALVGTLHGRLAFARGGAKACAREGEQAA